MIDTCLAKQRAISNTDPDRLDVPAGPKEKKDKNVRVADTPLGLERTAFEPMNRLRCTACSVTGLHQVPFLRTGEYG